MVVFIIKIGQYLQGMKHLLAILLLLYTSVQLSAQTTKEYYDKALELYKGKNYKGALQQINQALLTDGANTDYLMLKANIQTRSKQYKDAYETLSHTIELHPGYAWAWNNRGLLLNTVQQFEDALQDFDHALQLDNPDSILVSLYVNRGTVKNNMRNVHGAYNDFMAAYKLDSTDIGIINNLAAVCVEVGLGDSTLIY
jgi:tetratricopeptide (TPR) repeat protein